MYLHLDIYLFYSMGTGPTPFIVKSTGAPASLPPNTLGALLRLLNLIFYRREEERITIIYRRVCGEEKRQLLFFEEGRGWRETGTKTRKTKPAEPNRNKPNGKEGQTGE